MAKIAFDCLVLPVIVILQDYPLYRLSTDNQQCPEKKSRAIFSPEEKWGSAMANLNGHETGDGGYSQRNAYGNSPFLDPTAVSKVSI